MEREEIITRRKAIQEFMGWKLERSGPSSEEDAVYTFVRYENGKGVEVNCGGERWMWDKDGTLPYDTNWNWLMTVVDKIEKLGYNIEITNDGCNIDQYDSNIQDHVVFAISEEYQLSKIDNTFIACSDFAMKHLKQNK